MNKELIEDIAGIAVMVVVFVFFYIVL